jgi:hypothetical protein
VDQGERRRKASKGGSSFSSLVYSQKRGKERTKVSQREVLSLGLWIGLLGYINEMTLSHIVWVPARIVTFGYICTSIPQSIKGYKMRKWFVGTKKEKRKLNPKFRLNHTAPSIVLSK